MMKLNLRKFYILFLLVVTSLPAFAKEIVMTEKSGWFKSLSPTQFHFNKPVASVVKITYNPLYFFSYGKKSVHVLDLTDQKGNLVAIAEEYWPTARHSIVQLKAIGTDKREILIGTITESTDSTSPHLSRFSVSDAYDIPVAKGSENQIDGQVSAYLFRHGGRSEGEARRNSASSQVNEWTLQVRDPRVISPLLLASLIVFKRASVYRAQEITLGVGLGLLTGAVYRFTSPKHLLNKDDSRDNRENKNLEDDFSLSDVGLEY